jgi:hypothetical protein
MEDSQQEPSQTRNSLCKNLGVPWDEQVLSHRHSIFQMFDCHLVMESDFFIDSSAFFALSHIPDK